MGWNDNGFKKKSKSGGYVDFTTHEWKPLVTVAKVRTPCCVCPQDIKPGQRQGVVFDLDNGPAHVGCVVRYSNATVAVS